MAKIHHISIFSRDSLVCGQKYIIYLLFIEVMFPTTLSALQGYIFCTVLWQKFTLSLYALEIRLSVDKNIYKYTFSLWRSFPQTLPELYTDHQLYFMHSFICMYHITKYIYFKKSFTLFLMLSAVKKFSTFKKKSAKLIFSQIIQLKSVIHQETDSDFLQ